MRDPIYEPRVAAREYAEHGIGKSSRKRKGGGA